MTSKVILLGTGSPKPSHTRYQTSMALIAGGRPCIIDCGAGIMQRIAKAVETNPEWEMILTNLFYNTMPYDE